MQFYPAGFIPGSVKKITRSTRFPRQGDKQNSAFFEEYLIRLLEERDQIGLTDLIDQIDAIMITVDPGHSIRYIGELCLMTPYHYLVTLESESHWTHVLRVDMNSPDFLVREVKDPHTSGIFRSLNEVYPIGASKPNSRYMGEILRVTDLHSVVECQQEREFRFFSQDQIRKLELPGNLAIVKPSPYTHNIVGYMERPTSQIRTYALGISSINDEVQEVYQAAKELQKELRIDNLILPIDHLATRIYSQNREVAILEWLSLSSYYYWGSYDITDQNSSTNVTKSVHHDSEIHSPAKVFTANNTPYFINHLEKKPSRTETFVRNYGPRLHHIALAVCDGETDGKENIEHVVSQIASAIRVDVTEGIGGSKGGNHDLLGGKPAENNRMHGADTGAGQHRIRGLRNHGHIDTYAVTFPDAAFLQYVGKGADLTMQFAIGNLAVYRRVVAFPDDCRLVAAALQVAVDTVVAGVQFRALEPAYPGLVEVPIQHPVPGFVPTEKLFCLFCPEAFGVLDRAAIHLFITRRIDVCVGGNRCGYRIDLFLRHPPIPLAGLQ